MDLAIELTPVKAEQAAIFWKLQWIRADYERNYYKRELDSRPKSRLPAVIIGVACGVLFGAALTVGAGWAVGQIR